MSIWPGHCAGPGVGRPRRYIRESAKQTMKKPNCNFHQLMKVHPIRTNISFCFALSFLYLLETDPGSGIMIHQPRERDGIKIGPDLHNEGPGEPGIEAGLKPGITDITDITSDS